MGSEIGLTRLATPPGKHQLGLGNCRRLLDETVRNHYQTDPVEEVEDAQLEPPVPDAEFVDAVAQVVNLRPSQCMTIVLDEPHASKALEPRSRGE
jgi:hypothetical protein